jgi:hypothetical protein
LKPVWQVGLFNIVEDISGSLNLSLREPGDAPPPGKPRMPRKPPANYPPRRRAHLPKPIKIAAEKAKRAERWVVQSWIAAIAALTPLMA